MNIAIKIALVTVLILVFYQDLRERRVWFFLFPLFAILGGYLFFNEAIWEFYLTNLMINLSMVAIILLVSYLVARFLLKKSLLKEALGLGDILFFIGFASSFPTITFLNFFVFSILLTLVLHQVLKMSSSKYQTVPLAGSMAIFLLGVYVANWAGIYSEVYLL